MKRNNVSFARKLRRTQTGAERKLWSALRNRQLAGLKFRRQFTAGQYSIDIYCPAHRLGIEADGGQHYTDQGVARDNARTQELAKAGIRLLRFSDREIGDHLEAVCKVILEAVQHAPSPESSPRRGEESKGVTETP